MISSHFSKSLSVFSLLLITSCISHSSQAKADERVFEKIISKTQKIVVIRHELEGIEKAKAQQECRELEKNLLPNWTSPMPDHFYIDIFSISSTDGEKKENLWQMKKYNSLSKLIYFDIFYEASLKKLVLIYKIDGATTGEVVNAKTDASHRRVLPYFLIDDQSFGVNIESAILSGSLSKSNLTISATNNIDEHYTFLWKVNQWVLIDYEGSPNPEYAGMTKENLPRRETGKGF